MTEALITLLDGYRKRRDGYLSTASAYKGCHAAKGVALRQNAAVCDMHIKELQAVIEEWRSEPVSETTAPRRRNRNTVQALADIRPDARSDIGQHADQSQPIDQGSGQVDVSQVRDDNDGTSSRSRDTAG